MFLVEIVKGWKILWEKFKLTEVTGMEVNFIYGVAGWNGKIYLWKDIFFVKKILCVFKSIIRYVFLV